MSNKAQERIRLRAARSAFVDSLGADVRARCFSVAPSPLASLFVAGRCVAGYRPIDSEADPSALMLAAAAAGCRIALPHVTSRTAPMQFLEWNLADPLIGGPFGLSQPAVNSAVVSPDLVLVPLVAFDRTGNRLGQGAGHYDRALSLLPRAIKIGVAWSVQEVDQLNADPWDEPLDAIVTEREWIVR